jgi:cell division protein FtsN
MTSQRGGFAIGLIVGLLLGLTLALGVALYVTKVPVPFINKVPQRTPDQDAAETERNKNWDPNAPLANKPAGKAAPASAPTAAAPTATRTPPAAAAAPAAVPAKPADSTAVAKSTKPGTDAFMYFIQVGAYARLEDAEQQHARIGLMGMPAKVSEREQSGRTVYRVRLGPFDRKDEADAVQARLAGNGVEAALVRVER